MFNYDKAMADTANETFLNDKTWEGVDDTPADYNVDDFGNHVYDSDWIFIGYANINGVRRKFVATQDGFGKVLDEYQPENIILGELDIISGKEWFGARWTEERE